MRRNYLRLFCFLVPMALILSAAGTSYSKVLNVCDDVADPLTLDPHKQFSEKNYTICWQIFEGLLRFDPGGKIEPALAVSWQRIDPNRMRFKLREGVVFHNGEPFNAEAVKFSVERHLNPETGFPAPGFIASISGAEVLDPHTVDIVTKYPDGILLNRLAWIILMVPPGYIKEKGNDFFAANPVGTGPFVFKEWEKGEKIVLSANAGYWMKGYPRASGLVFHFILQDKQVEALISGKVDLLTDLPGTQTFLIAAGKNTKIVKQPELYTYVASLDVSTGALADRNFRMAVNYAVDKTQLIRYDAMGNGKPLGALAMPGEIGYSSDIKPYPFDLEKARGLIKKSRYKNITFKVFVKVQAERTAKIIARQLKKIGIILDLHVFPDGLMQAALKDQKWDIVFGNCPDPLVHSFFVQAIILSSLSPFSVMRDPNYDKMLGELVSSLTVEEQQKNGEALQRYIHDNALGIFTYQRIRTYAMRRDLMFMPYITGMPYFYSTENKHERNKEVRSSQKR